MSFSSPASGAASSGGATPTHMTFGDHLLQAVSTASPTIGGLLGVAGVHPHTVAAVPTDAQPVTVAAAPTAYNNTPLPDYSSLIESNAKPQGGSVLGSLLSALMG